MTASDSTVTATSRSNVVSAARTRRAGHDCRGVGQCMMTPGTISQRRFNRPQVEHRVPSHLPYAPHIRASNRQTVNRPRFHWLNLHSRCVSRLVRLTVRIPRFTPGFAGVLTV